MFHARTAYLAFVALMALSFSTFGTLSALYRVQVAGLDPLQLVLLGTALELSVLLFEVPTGLLADLYSRRASVILGMVLIGLGFALEGLLPVFGAMLLAQMVWGLGVTFESGASAAWLSDEIGVEAANRTFLRAAQLGQIFGLLGIGSSVLLAQVHLGLPLVAGGVGFGLNALFLLLFMPERGFVRSPSVMGDPFGALRQTFGAALALALGRPLILSIFLITALLGASSEAFDRLSEAHLLLDIGLPGGLSPALAFGLVAAGSSLLSLLATEVVRRRVDTSSHVAVARTLLGITLLLSLAVVGFGVAGNFALALALYGSVRLLRTLSAPLSAAWLNQNLEPGTRATVFSMNGQMDALGQIALGPLLGLVAQAYGMPAAFVAAGIVLLPAAQLYRRTLRRPAGAS